MTEVVEQVALFMRFEQVPIVGCEETSFWSEELFRARKQFQVKKIKPHNKNVQLISKLVESPPSAIYDSSRRGR